MSYTYFLLFFLDGTFAIVCNELYVTGIWERKKLRANELQISLNDHSCRDYEGNVTHVWITAKFNRCGSLIHEDVNSIIQENTASITFTYVNSTIYRRITHRYNMKCTFDREKTASTSNSFNSTDKVDTIYRLSTTTFNVSMAIFTSPSYLKIAANPFSVTSFQPIYIGIKEINHNENVKFIVHQCYATPDFNIHTIRYTFFDMQCALDPTFKIESYNNNHFNFSIGAFKFIEIRKSVFIHCNLYVCKVDSVSPPCTQACRARKRRSVSDVSTNEDRPLKEFGVQTSEIIFKKKLSCNEITCQLDADCWEMYPAICRCKNGYVFHREENICETFGLFYIKDLTLEMEYINSLDDPTTKDFVAFATEVEEDLHTMLPSENGKIAGIKVVGATEGSVVIALAVIHTKTSNKYEAFDLFIKQVMVNDSNTSQRLKIKLNIMPTMEIYKIQPIEEDDTVLLVAAILSPLLLLIICAGIFIYKMKHKKGSRVGVGDRQHRSVEKNDIMIMELVS